MPPYAATARRLGSGYCPVMNGGGARGRVPHLGWLARSDARATVDSDGRAIDGRAIEAEESPALRLVEKVEKVVASSENGRIG